MKQHPVLYHYWRSSSSWRVRWAMKLKKFEAEMVAVSLLDGESESEAHMKRNPLGYVPVLVLPDHTLIESVAIVEWLEETLPTPSLFPGDPYQRAHIRALVEIVNAGIQPIQNLTVLERHSSDEKEKKEWSQHFIRRGLDAYEKLCSPTAGRFSVGDHITAADLFLIPQCANAKRFDIPLSEFPLLEKIFEAAMATPEAKATAPDAYKPE